MAFSTVFTWAVVAALVALVLGLTVVLRRTHGDEASHINTSAVLANTAQASERRVWVIYNPIKPDDVEEFRNRVAAEVAITTGNAPVWLETKIEDPGVGQAVAALAGGANLVIAAGGDGTVRSVAAGLAHSGVALAILPMGTGNLLARNLGIPLDLDAALKVALAPLSRRLDLAWLRVSGRQGRSLAVPEGKLLAQANAKFGRTPRQGVTVPRTDEYSYTVIAGVGFDGQTMAETDPELKKKIGWNAYVVAALKAMRIERMKATVRVCSSAEQDVGGATTALGRLVKESHVLPADEDFPNSDLMKDGWQQTKLSARTILFANCGTLPFAVLAPEASLDDGEMDLIAVDTRAGLVGWMYLSMKVMGQTAGMKPINTKHDLGLIQFRQTPKAAVSLTKGFPVQVDGDAIGDARDIFTRVDPKALLVRVPKSTVQTD